MLNKEFLNNLTTYQNNGQNTFSPLILKDNNNLEKNWLSIPKNYYSQNNSLNGVPLDTLIPEQNILRFTLTTNCSVTSNEIVDYIKKGFMPMLFIPGNGSPNYNGPYTSDLSNYTDKPVNLPFLYYENLPFFGLVVFFNASDFIDYFNFDLGSPGIYYAKHPCALFQIIGIDDTGNYILPDSLFSSISSLPDPDPINTGK